MGLIGSEAEAREWAGIPQSNHRDNLLQADQGAGSDTCLDAAEIGGVLHTGPKGEADTAGADCRMGLGSLRDVHRRG